MAGWLDTLRDGGWLTLGRLRLWALAVLVASAAGLVYLVATSDGLNDYQGRPLGTDFSNIYVARTAFSDRPRKRVIRNTCFIMRKNSSISQRRL